MKTLKAYYTSIITILLILGLVMPAAAQTGSEAWLAEGFGHFFITVIAGILLAFAFQFLLTNLAVATGITAIGDVRDLKTENRSGSSDKNRRDRDKDKDSTPTGVKFSSAFGIYLTLTLTISLFFASYIAVNLSLIPNNTIGFTLGLVIWAGTLLLSLYMDSKIVSTLTGSIYSSVKDMLGAGSSAVGSLFSSVGKNNVQDTARETVKAIHDEISQEFDLSGIEGKLDEYVSKLKPHQLDMKEIRKQISELIQEIEVKEEYSPEDPETVRHLFLQVASEQPHLSEEDKNKLKNAFEEVREIPGEEGSKADKVKSAVNKFTPGDTEQGKEFWESVKNYLRETHQEELQPERLKEDLNEMINDPKAAPEVVQARVSQFDRSTLKSLLSNVEGMTDQKSEEYLSQAEEVIDYVKSKAVEVKDRTQTQVNEARDNTETQSSEMKTRTEKAIRNWFDRMNQPELQYDRLKHDARRILDDPKATPSILKNRLKRMDRESVIALVSNNPAISREQAEKIAAKIEEGRDEVLQKAEEIERTVKEKSEKLRQETMRQIENTRKTAAAAAWWVFIAAIVSGGASALGGILAIT